MNTNCKKKMCIHKTDKDFDECFDCKFNGFIAPKKEVKIRIQALVDKASSLELEIVWIPHIMERQTYDEIIKGQTIVNNGIGLSGVDGSFISDIYSHINEGNHLSDNQAKAARKILRKYWKQYSAMMENK